MTDATVEKTKTGEAVITVRIPADQLRGDLEAAARELGRDLDIPGFRKGAAPLPVVEGRIGKEKLFQHAVERAVQRTYLEVMEREELVTAGAPKIDLDTPTLEAELSYRATVALLPTVTLGTYRDLKPRRKPVTVKPEQVDLLLEELRRRRANESPAARPAAKGDRLKISFETYLDTIPIEGGKVADQDAEIGQGQLIPGFEDQLIGLSAGQEKSFTLRMPDDHAQKSLAGRTVEFKVRVQSVTAVTLPALDDAFAMQVGKFPNLAALRTQLETNLREELTDEEERRFETTLLEDVAKHSQISVLPPSMLSEETEKMLHELKHDVERRGMEFPKYLESVRKTEDAIRTEFRPQAEKRLRFALVTREIAARENIEATEEEIQQEVSSQLARTYDPAAIEQLKSTAYARYLGNVMTTQKVYRFLVDATDPRPKPPPVSS